MYEKDQHSCTNSRRHLGDEHRVRVSANSDFGSTNSVDSNYSSGTNSSTNLSSANCHILPANGDNSSTHRYESANRCAHRSIRYFGGSV